jgi:hypothetical protein
VTDPFVQANDWPETAAQRAAAADAAAQQPLYVYRHHFLEQQVNASDRGMVLFWCDLCSKKIHTYYQQKRSNVHQPTIRQLNSSKLADIVQTITFKVYSTFAERPGGNSVSKRLLRPKLQQIQINCIIQLLFIISTDQIEQIS